MPRVSVDECGLDRLIDGQVVDTRTCEFCPAQGKCDGVTTNCVDTIHKALKTKRVKYA